MAHNQKLGQKGENHAKAFLESKGYEILEQNWRMRPAEIDLIVRQEHILVFVEVKTRTYKGFNNEEWGITETKKETLVDGAYFYMNKIKWQGDFRFDVLMVSVSGEKLTFDHVVDAFFPGIEGF